MSESQKACSLWLPLKESQVLLALYKSCQEISSHQLCKEAVVPQLNNPPPHNKMLSLNPEEIFCLVTDLMCARRWWKHFFFLFSLSPWITSTAKTVTCKICGILTFFFWGVRMYLHTGSRTGRHALRWGCVLGVLLPGPGNPFCPGIVLLGVTASKHYKNDEESEYRAEKWGEKRNLEKYRWACCRVTVSASGLSQKPWGVLGLLWECTGRMGHWSAELKTQTAWAQLLNLKPKRKQRKCVKPQQMHPILL